jgi:hypothetical protein
VFSAAILLSALSPFAVAQARASDGDACDAGLAALREGDFDAAREAFADPSPQEFDCSEAGLAILEAREAAAKNALEDCGTLIDEANAAEEADAPEARAKAVERCTVAVSLDRDSEEAQEALGKAEALGTEGETITDRIEEFSSDTWGVLERLFKVLGSWLVVLALALPLLAIAQLFVGRLGRKKLRGIRRTFREQRWLQLVSQTILGVALIAVLVGDWTLPNEAFRVACVVGAAMVLGASVRTMGVGGVIGFILGAGLLIAAGVVDTSVDAPENVLVIVGGALLLFLLLAWVRSQTSSIRIGPFAKEGGESEPPAVFGPLVAAEVLRLASSGRASVDIVDAGGSIPEFDTDALNALVGAESKLAGALSKLLNVLVRPSDYVVTGQLVEETTRGVGVTMQFKRGPRLIDAVTFYASTFRLQDEEAAAVADDSATSPAAKEEDGSASPRKHPELASAAAAWILTTVLRELTGDSEDVLRRAFDGATRWESIAFQLMGNRAFEAGDVKTAATLYALAVDADRGNRAARLNDASIRQRLPRKSQTLERLAYDSVELEARALLSDHAEDGKALHLRAAYLLIATLANRRSLPGQPAYERNRDEETILRVLTGEGDVPADEALAYGVLLDALREDAPAGWDEPGLEPLRLEAQSTLAAVQLEFGILDPSAEKLERRATSTMRGTYNLAAWKAKKSESLPGAERERLRKTSLRLLDSVSRVPELAAIARTDPYFRCLKDDPAFREIVGEPEAPGEDEPGLAAFLLIGEGLAKRLAGKGIGSFDRLRAKSVPSVVEALGGDASDSAVARWKSAAAMEAIPGIDVRRLNMLVLAGVSTLHELENKDAEQLAATLKPIALALSEPVPSALTVGGWIAEARAARQRA